MGWDTPFFIEALWLVIAFFCGLLAKRIGLPPLVGFLVAGFILNFSGLDIGALHSNIEAMADIGVMLLLFTIGLKLKLKSLFRKAIWVTSSVHLIITTLIVSGLIFLLSFFGLSMFANFSYQSALLIGFAMSFSSTVFVVKTLESRGEFTSFHGKITIGILVIQDIFAVFFMTFSDQKVPSVWIFILPFILWIFYKILSKILDSLEHGEMVPVFGFFATFIAGAYIFHIIGIKPDLGALIVGMLLVNHPRADELYNRMIEYKDFFLIAFFINVGLIGLPTLDIVLTALILLPIVLLKGFLFLFMLSKSSLQPRTAYLASLSLTNYSEFGLIVGVVGMNAGWVSEEWVIVLALMMSMSFIIAAPLNMQSHRIFNRYKKFILKLNNEEITPDDEPQNFGDAEIIVVGLGNIGTPTFKLLNRKFPNKVIGLDYDYDKIERLQSKNYNVDFADTTDSELWENVDMSKVKAIFLTISDFTSMLNTLEELKRLKNKNFKTYAICHYPDQIKKYKSYDVDFIFDYKENLGFDFVDNVLNNQPIFEEMKTR